MNRENYGVAFPKEIVLLGSGGFAREVRWLIEENNKIENEWNILGYISEEPVGTETDGLKVLGNDEWLINRKEPISAVCCIGDGNIRKKIIEKFEGYKHIYFPNIISTSTQLSDSVQLGKGCIITANNILTVNISIGDFFICNLACTVGHDTVIGDYVTLNPGVHVSGNVSIGDCVSVGTGTNIIQGIKIVNKVVIGAGAAVVRDILESAVVGGVPAKVLKRKENKNESMES